MSIGIIKKNCKDILLLTYELLKEGKLSYEQSKPINKAYSDDIDNFFGSGLIGFTGCISQINILPNELFDKETLNNQKFNDILFLKPSYDNIFTHIQYSPEQMYQHYISKNKK